MTYNFEVEKAYLGCLLIENKLIVSGKLPSEAFYLGAHKKLYEEIIETYEKQGAADINLLKSVKIDELVDLMNNVLTISNFCIYQKQLMELKAKRDILKVAESVKNEVNNFDGTIEELKGNMLSAINDIEVLDNEKECVSILDICVESLNVLEDRHNNNKTPLKWGISWLDEKTGGVKPTLTYLAARPSVGKTALALQISKFIAKQGGKVAVFSLEMDKISVVNRMICNAGNINKDYFDKSVRLPDEVWAKLSETVANVSNLPIFVYDKYFRIEEILLKAEEQRLKDGLDVLVLDYIQLAETSQNFKSANERISYISRQLKKYQQKTGVSILALSQFSRGADTNEYPALSHLRDSGSLEQDGRNIWFLHCEKDDPTEHDDNKGKEVKLIIAKQSEGERNIFKKLKFYGKTQRFYEN
jgi:replicative DNA helicase